MREHVRESWLNAARDLHPSVVYWAAMLVWCEATQGKWSHTVIPELTVGEALSRWLDAHPGLDFG